MIALAIIALGLVGAMVSPRRVACEPAAAARVNVDGSAWRIPTALQPELVRDEHGPKYPQRWDARRGYIYCQDATASPFRQRAFYIHPAALRKLAEQNPPRYSGLADLQLVAVGGPLRRSVLPDGEHNEFYGPYLFRRPTVVWRQDVYVPTLRRRRPLYRLSGWAPGGVAVLLIYSDGDAARSVAAAEALLSDLRDASVP